jgi:hypothetical protein
MTGGVVSSTTTGNVPVAWLPCESVAVQTTVVVPSANLEPDAGLHATATAPSTVSVAVGCSYVTVAPDASTASTVRSASPVIDGGVVSRTVISNVPLTPGVPSSSPVVHVTVVVPIGNVDPEGGSHVTDTCLPAGFVAVAS